MIKRHLDDLICISIIAVVPFILFWRWVFKGEVLFWGTPLLQFWPWHHLSKTALLQGEWPLWNPLLGNGTPLLANLQSAVFYPLNLIYLLLPIEHALTFSVILHLGLAGLFMYALARRLALAPFPALLSALAYMLSGYIVGRTQFVTMVNAAAWLPLVLLLVEGLATRRQSLDILGLATILAIQFLAGHAQLWFYTLCLSGAYLLFRSWQASQSRRLRHLLHSGLGFTLAVGLSLLLAAVQLLPTAELVLHSSRSEGAERGFALTYSFWPWRLITLLAPDFFGNPAQGNYWGYANYWEDHAYLGILPFLLAMVAIFYYLRRRFHLYDQFLPPLDLARPPWSLVPFLAGLVPLSLILALGWNTPVYLWVFETIPGFSFFQGPARLLIWYTLAMALLAGIGAQYFISPPESKPNWRRFLAACIALTLAGLIGEAFLAGRIVTFLTATWQMGLRLILAISLLLLRPGQKMLSSLKEKLWHWAIIIFVAFDLLGAAWPLQPAAPATLFRQPITTAAQIQSQPENYRLFIDEDFAYRLTFDQFFRFSDFGPADLAHWQSFKEMLAPNFGVYAALASANNNDPLVIGLWQQLIRPLAETEPEIQARLLALMHAGYFVTEAGRLQGRILHQDRNFTLQEVPDPLPRAYFVTERLYVRDEVEGLARLQGTDFEPRRQVMLLGEAEVPRLEPAALAATVPVRVIQEKFNEIKLRVDAPRAGFVVLTDTYYPGWEASIDGQPVPILQANLAFRAVAVEAGIQTLHFRYSPLSFTFGLWTSFATWFIIGLTILKYRPGTST